MQSQIEDLSPVEKKLAVEIPWEAVREKLDEAYRELGKGVQLRGFRKGKVPRSVLERMFGGQVKKEVANQLVQESFLAAAQEHQLNPVAEPVVEDAVIKNGEAFRYSARVEVRGPVELKEWEGLAVTRTVAKVSEAEVDRALEQKRMAHTEFRAISERTRTAATDVVMIAIKGTAQGQKIDRQELTVDLGRLENEPLPGLAEALIGLTFDAVDAPIELPEASLKVTVREVREKVVPALDDEFAKDTGEADSLEELRGKLRSALEQRARERGERDAREALIKELVAKNPMPLAPALVERGIDSQVQRARLSFAMQGLDLDAAGVDLSSMRDKLRDGAADEIRGQLLLEAIADKEAIVVSDADVDGKVAELAKAQNKAAQRVKAEMDREGTLDTLRWRLRQEKALDLVASRATITEAEAAPAAPDALDEGAEAAKENPEP